MIIDPVLIRDLLKKLFDLRSPMPISLFCVEKTNYGKLEQSGRIKAGYSEFYLDGYPAWLVDEYIRILTQYGFIECEYAESGYLTIHCITLDGYHFLGNAVNDSIWDIVFTGYENVGGYSFDIFLDVLKKQAYRVAEGSV